MEDRPEETHPILQCIFHNNLQELQDFLKNSDIDGVYPCRERGDDVTPLTAAVVNHQEDVCAFLLREGADPNKVSRNGLTPLHYAARSQAPLVFVTRLLEANANPDGVDHDKPQEFTPLQTAAIHDRHDVVQELISAGAQVTLLPLTVPEHNTHNAKLSAVIHHLAASGDEFCSRIRVFLDLDIAVQEKPPEEVFKTFDRYMLLEHPQTHLTVIDSLYSVAGVNKDKYCQGSINWLSDNRNLFSYIVSALSRAVEEIPNEQAVALIPRLLEQLCLKETPDVCESALKALFVVTQKTTSSGGWDPSFVDKLCKTVAPFIEDQHSSENRVYAYGIFANLLPVQRAVDLFASLRIASVPEDILASADVEMNERLKEGLRRLNNHFSTPDSESDHSTPHEEGKKEKSGKREGRSDDALTAGSDGGLNEFM